MDNECWGNCCSVKAFSKAMCHRRPHSDGRDGKPRIDTRHASRSRTLGQMHEFDNDLDGERAEHCGARIYLESLLSPQLLIPPHSRASTGFWWHRRTGTVIRRPCETLWALCVPPPSLRDVDRSVHVPIPQCTSTCCVETQSHTVAVGSAISATSLCRQTSQRWHLKLHLICVNHKCITHCFIVFRSLMQLARHLHAHETALPCTGYSHTILCR